MGVVGLRGSLLVGVALALVASACTDDTEGRADTAGSSTTTSDGAGPVEVELAGTFTVAAGRCPDVETVAGTYFRMVEVGGTVTDGPFVPNPDSPCADNTYTPLTPGSDRGLIAGVHQPAPGRTFDDAGSARAGAIVEPFLFGGVGFGIATEATGAETGDALPPPALVVEEDSITGQVSALTAYYAGEVFSQGAPPPGGSQPGPTGTLNAVSGAYALEWSSVISGGVFNDRTGIWHLEGRFVAR